MDYGILEWNINHWFICWNNFLNYCITLPCYCTVASISFAHYKKWLCLCLHQSKDLNIFFGLLKQKSGSTLIKCWLFLIICVIFVWTMWYMWYMPSNIVLPSDLVESIDQACGQYSCLLNLKGILTNQIAPFAWKWYHARPAGLIYMILDCSLVVLYFAIWQFWYIFGNLLCFV